MMWILYAHTLRKDISGMKRRSNIGGGGGASNIVDLSPLPLLCLRWMGKGGGHNENTCACVRSWTYPLCVHVYLNENTHFVICLQAFLEYTIRVFLLPIAYLNYCIVHYLSNQMTVCYKFHVQKWHILMLLQHCPLE